MTIEATSKREFQNPPLQAEIYVICGPMFSGKSTELIQVISRLPFARYKVQAFKPDLDHRRGESINSENGLKFNATSIKFSSQILDLVLPETDVVAVDEAQFLDPEFPDVCEILAKKGKRVIVAGLDKDFRGEPFGPMGRLKEIADKVDMLHAYCVCCGRRATRTQRIIVSTAGERRPANYSDPTVLIGATEAYEARCRDHHEVPGKPEIRIPENGELMGPLTFFVSIEGEVLSSVTNILQGLGHKVFVSERPPDEVAKLGQDLRVDWSECDVAIFGKNTDASINQLKEWFETGRPSLFLAEGIGDVNSWAAHSVRYFCKRIVSLKTPSDLDNILGNFLNEVRIELKQKEMSKRR